MNKQDVMKLQTCVLRVNIHCDGCKHKVKKLLQKIEGVYSVKAEVDQGKVTVTGNVDPEVLIKKLRKSGKHAELCGGGGGGGNGFPNMNDGDKKPKGGKDNHQGKGNGGGGDHPMQQLGPQQIQQMMMMMKGVNGHGNGGGKDMKMPKDQKSVKFADEDDDEFDDDDDEFDDDDDEFDDDDDEFDDESDDEEGHNNNLPKQTMMMMPNKIAPNGSKGPSDIMMMNGLNKNGGGGGGFEIPVQMKGKSEGKNGNEGKKGVEKGTKLGKENKGSGGKNGKSEFKNGGLLGFLKKGKSGKGDDKEEDGGGNKVKSDDDGELHNFDFGSKNGGSKKGHNVGTHDIDEFMKQMKGGKKGNNHSNNGIKDVGVKMGPMGNYPAVQGFPMNGGGGGGFYPQPPPMNQQQYMQMMMRQQQAMAHGGYGGDIYQPMMYARPYPAVNYTHPPPPMPPPHSDSYAHYFSDENASSCSIM